MTDVQKLISELETMPDRDVIKARDEALRMARHNILVAEAALAILAGRGQGTRKIAETLKLARRVGAVQ